MNYLVRNEKQNKSYAYDKEVPKSKKAILHYRLIGKSDNYFLLKVDLDVYKRQAIIEYGKALEKDGTQVDLWREISDAHEMNNNYAEAIAAYRKYYDCLLYTS